MLADYTRIAALTRHGFNQTFHTLNRTTNSLLGQAGVSRGAVSPQGGVLASLSANERTAISGGITAATARIARNDAATTAIDSIHDKLDTMRSLVADVALGSLSEPEIEAKDAEYQVLVGEIEDLIEETTYDDEQILTGRNAVANLPLYDVLNMSLTDLPDSPLAIMSEAMTHVAEAKQDLTADSRSMDSVITDLQDQLDEVSAFETQLTTAEQALQVLQTITEQMISQPLAALTGQQEVSANDVLYLLTAPTSTGS